MSKYNRLYQDLLQRGFFKDKWDIALSGTCDGYQIFEQRTDDCWVILFINNNLHPFIRVTGRIIVNRISIGHITG